MDNTLRIGHPGVEFLRLVLIALVRVALLPHQLKDVVQIMFNNAFRRLAVFEDQRFNLARQLVDATQHSTSNDVLLHHLQHLGTLLHLLVVRLVIELPLKLGSLFVGGVLRASLVT